MSVNTNKRQAVLDCFKSAENMYASAYSDEVKKAIYESAAGDDKELRNQATLLVYKGLENYIIKTMMHFGILSTHKDFEDLKQNVFLALYESLPTWDPDKGSLTCWFSPYIKSTCLDFRNNNSFYSSRYYEIVANDINYAKKEFEDKGIDNPNVLELREYMQMNMNRHHSENTISKCLKQNKQWVSLDVIEDYQASNTTDPVYEVINKEQRQDIERCIAQLEPQHKIIIETELELIEKDNLPSDSITDKLLTESILDKIPLATVAWVKSVRRAAENSFKEEYKKLCEPAHKIGEKTFDMSFIQEFHEDIERAALVDLESLFAS